MSFSNLEYLYDHLPGRYRRDDTDLVLKRVLTFAGETLDEWDEAFEDFYKSIDPETAAAEWIGFWMYAFFGWSWFPSWFTLADKRRVYGNFAQHLARRGTAKGIELFLEDFGIVARVHKRPVVWGEFAWGESSFSITQPLHLVVEILRIENPPADLCFYGEGVWGEMFWLSQRRPLSESDILNLVRYQQPHAQVIDVSWKLRGYQPADYTPYWGQISW
jgi:hypothetical protein